MPLGDIGGVLPLEKFDVEVEPLCDDDRLSRLLELSRFREHGASWVSVIMSIDKHRTSWVSVIVSIDKQVFTTLDYTLSRPHS